MLDARSRPVRAARLLLDGALLLRDNIAYTAILTPWLAAEMVMCAISDAGSDDPACARLVEEATEAAQTLPLGADADRVRRWFVQIRGGQPSYQFSRAAQFTVADLGALIALGAGAASMAGLNRQTMYEKYAAAGEVFTHGSRIPTEWR